MLPLLADQGDEQQAAAYSVVHSESHCPEQDIRTAISKRPQCKPCINTCYSPSCRWIMPSGSAFGSRNQFRHIERGCGSNAANRVGSACWLIFSTGTLLKRPGQTQQLSWPFRKKATAGGQGNALRIMADAQLLLKGLVEVFDGNEMGGCAIYSWRGGSVMLSVSIWLTKYLSCFRGEMCHDKSCINISIRKN